MPIDLSNFDNGNYIFSLNFEDGKEVTSTL